MKGKRKRGQPKKTWKMQVEESKSVGLEKKDVMNRARVGTWRDCCQSGVNLATPICRDKPRSKLD